uniref:Uncharacterized protein n=1 Tax=Tetradesmus obliquus TaxID=3088 RepID=A0A383VSY5_TETOB
MMERFTDAERKQLAFSVLIAGASVLSSAQVQQQGIPAAACRPGSVQEGLGCGQLDLGSCSRTGTPASLQAASMREAGHAYYAYKCIGHCPAQSHAQQGGCHGQRVQGTMPAALEDSTSPLSSNSFALVGGVLTPCGAEAVSAARVGCKRSYDAVEQQQQQYQQVLLSQQQQQARAHQQQQRGVPLAHQQHAAAQLMASQQQQQLARQQQAVLLIKQRQATQQQQAQLQKQAAAQQQQYQRASQLQQQLAAQQQQQHQQMQTLLAAGQQLASVPQAASAAVLGSVAKAAAAAGAASRAYEAASCAAHQQQQQLLLMPQGSGTSTSSGFSSTTAPAAASTSAFGAAAAANTIWQQLVQAQDHKCQLSAVPAAHNSLRVQQPAPLLGSASSLTTSSSSTSSSAGVFASYLQQQQQQHAAAKRRLQQQPPTKRAATQAAVAALLGHNCRQQHQLAATAGSSNSLQTLALLSPAASAPGPRRALAEVGANRLLAWAGQILGCQLQDAYHLAVHIFKRTAGRLDDMLLISLGATLPVDSVTMLVSLWLATKLEGHRRQVAGCSKLAGALALLPWAVTAIELHMMQLMDWQPYAGWALREQERSCTVTEVY